MENPDLPLTNVRAWRQHNGLTMAQLAVAANISTGTLSRMENATRHEDLGSLGVGKFFTLAKLLGCSPLDLYPGFGGSESSSPRSEGHQPE